MYHWWSTRRISWNINVFFVPGKIVWGFQVRKIILTMKNDWVCVKSSAVDLVKNINWSPSALNFIFWGFQISKNQCWQLILFLTKTTLRLFIHYHEIFIVKIISFVLENPQIIFFEVKRQHWNFKKNQRADHHSYIEEIFQAQIRDLETRKPPGGEFNRILLMLQNVSFFYFTPLQP